MITTLKLKLRFQTTLFEPGLFSGHDVSRQSRDTNSNRTLIYLGWISEERKGMDLLWLRKFSVQKATNEKYTPLKKFGWFSKQATSQPKSSDFETRAILKWKAGEERTALPGRGGNDYSLS